MISPPVLPLSSHLQPLLFVNVWPVSPSPRKLYPDRAEPPDFGEGGNRGICKHCGWSGCS